MEIDQISQELRTFVRKRFQVPETDHEFTDDVHLFDYGYIDSFGAVELIAFVETAFGIKVRQSDLVAYPLNTVREIATFVLQRQRGEV